MQKLVASHSLPHQNGLVQQQQQQQHQRPEQNGDCLLQYRVMMVSEAECGPQHENSSETNRSFCSPCPSSEASAAEVSSTAAQKLQHDDGEAIRTRPLPGQWQRLLCPPLADTPPLRHHVWHTQQGLRVEFRGHRFTIPADVHLVDGSDTAHDETLEFDLLGMARDEPAPLIARLRSIYCSPHSSLFIEGLRFDAVDGRLYATMPSSISSDFIAELVHPQLRSYQKRVAHRFPAQPPLALSGSSGLIQIDSVSIRLCGDGCILDKNEMVQKTLEVHALRKAVPRNLKVYVNFEALSFNDSKPALIRKCRDQVVTGQAKVVVALCDRQGDGEVLVFSKGGGGDIILDRSVSPRFINLDMVLPSFRIYLAYGASIYFQAYHGYQLSHMCDDDLICLLCDSILQGDRELAKEIVNSLPSVNHVDRQGRLAMVCASEQDDKEMVSYLIDNGGEVEKMDARGVSPLLAARAKRYADVASLVESKGATIDISFFALREAINNSQVVRLELLLQAGAQVDEVDEQGRSPLMYACFLRSESIEQIVQVLLGAGASLALRDRHGHTACDIASWVGNEAVLKAIDVSHV